jgi:hypothetical protein
MATCPTTLPSPPPLQGRPLTPAHPAATATIAVDVDRNNIQLVHTLTHNQSYILNGIDIAPSPIVRPCSPDCRLEIRGDEGYHLLIYTHIIFKGSPKKQTG